jgi:putative DNA-invertase from lambdoid prophage Rac
MSMEVDHVFVDEGISGSVPLARRPEGSRLLAALKKGDIVIAASLDRMFRSALDALTIIDQLQKRDVGLRFLDLAEGSDVRNGIGKLLLTILAAVAEQERDKIRERIRYVKAHQREAGRYLGGKVPFGYRVEKGGPGDGAGRSILVEDAGEQRIIQFAQRLRSQGHSLRDLRRTVDEKYGRRLSLDALSRIVQPEKGGTQ